MFSRLFTITFFPTKLNFTFDKNPLFDSMQGTDGLRARSAKRGENEKS